MQFPLPDLAPGGDCRASRTADLARSGLLFGRANTDATERHDGLRSHRARRCFGEYWPGKPPFAAAAGGVQKERGDTLGPLGPARGLNSTVVLRSFDIGLT